jgi:hypothetical protein
MKILSVKPMNDTRLHLCLDNGESGYFDLKPYLNDEAFIPLQKTEERSKIINGGYFVEWACGADLSLDTLLAHWDHS